MLNKKDIEIRKELAIEVSKDAGRMLLRNFGKISHIKTKSDRNLVTDIDLKADEIITSKIKRYFKADNIISEESPLTDFKSDYTWIIDPLDGTHNYIHNIDIFGVSVGVAFKEEGVIGIIYMPCTDELYVASKGGSAYCNKRRIYVSERDINSATVVFDSSIRYNKKVMLKDLGEVSDRVFNVRMLGSTARSLTYIAEGKVEAEIEYNDEVWDYAAGLLLVEEAGGLSTDFKGNRWNIKTKGYIASNKRVHQGILDIVNSPKS